MRSLPVTQLRSHPHRTPEVSLTLSFMSCGETWWDVRFHIRHPSVSLTSDTSDLHLWSASCHRKTFKLSFKTKKQDSDKVPDHFPLKPRHKSQNASLTEQIWIRSQFWCFYFLLVSGCCSVVKPGSHGSVSDVISSSVLKLSVDMLDSCWQILSVQVILSNKNQNQNSFGVPQTGKCVSTATGQKYYQKQ